MRMRQIRTTVILLILIAGTVFGAFYFEEHPFLENAGRPTPTPEPLPSPTFRSFNPMRTVEVRSTATPDPIREPEEQQQADPQQTEAITRLYTTEEGVIFTFNYSSDKGELPSVLQALKDIGAQAVFFLKCDDLTLPADDAQNIISAGHEIGILMEKDSGINAERQLELVQESENKLRSMGYTGEVFVRTAYGAPTETHLRAAAMGGYRLIGYLADLIPERVSRLSDAEEILAQVFSEFNNVALQRGEIVSFQMGLFQHSNTVLADYIRAIAAQYLVYPVRSLGAMLGNTELLYTYPLPDEQILPEVLNAIHPGHLKGVADPMTVIAERYIGTVWVNIAEYLPGFTAQERYKLDKRGFVKNEKNHAYLTFDDWGPDETLSKLLSVLKKHDAKATFFVRTNNLDYNPNLLRAIAMEGHTIACHTDRHFPLSHETKNGRLYETLTDEEALELQQDLVRSYDRMQRIVGDLTIDGKPALSKLFRPPTLAVSKIGLQTVFDCGFTYSVSGSFSTEDYKATSAERLYRTMLANTRSGAVLVMHMSQNSVYTAEAVDLLLTEMKRRNSPLRFVSLAEDLE